MVQANHRQNKIITWDKQEVALGQQNVGAACP